MPELTAAAKIGEAVDRAIRYSIETMAAEMELTADKRENSIDESNLTLDDISLGRLPPASERVKSSDGELVLKMCNDSEWHRRMIVATNETLMVAHPGKDDIADQIPLVR
jgi:hypothetical protein